jgi:hypothetical protein
MVMDNGSVSLKMESNILSTDEEKADTTTYIVTLPDISGYRADETEEWADDTDDDEWLETMVKAYMSNGVIPKEMPLQGGDRVLIRITSVGGSEEYAEMEGTEQYIWLSSNTSIDEAEEMMKGAHVGDTLSIPITGSDSEEDVAFEIEIESATGSRTMDDLCMEWIEANYPEYDSIDAFLEKVKSGRRKSGTELSEEGEFSLFLNYLTENSTIDGLEENEDHARTMLVEAAYLASHGVPINEEAFENYREENPDVEDSDEARTEFVRSAFVAAMYEDISG